MYLLGVYGIWGLLDVRLNVLFVVSGALELGDVPTIPSSVDRLRALSTPGLPQHDSGDIYRRVISQSSRFCGSGVSGVWLGMCRERRPLHTSSQTQLLSLISVPQFVPFSL
jgi:hypothetical protein